MKFLLVFEISFSLIFLFQPDTIWGTGCWVLAAAFSSGLYTLIPYSSTQFSLGIYFLGSSVHFSIFRSSRSLFAEARRKEFCHNGFRGLVWRVSLNKNCPNHDLESVSMRGEGLNALICVGSTSYIWSTYVRQPTGTKKKFLWQLCVIRDARTPYLLHNSKSIGSTYVWRSPLIGPSKFAGNQGSGFFMSVNVKILAS